MQMKNLAVLVALPFALVACGGGSSSSGGGGIVAPGASVNSQFIDAPVKGLKVEKVSGNGETGANGIFSCKAGETVTFWLKEINGIGISVGSASCGSLIYIDDLGANADKAGALIQSLSTGDHGSRKELDLSAFNATSFDLKTAVPNLAAIDDTAIGNVVSSVVTATNIPITEVKLADARNHINQYLPIQNDPVLAEIAASGEQILKLAPLASNPVDHCYENIQVKVQLEEIAAGGSKAYRFKVNEYLAYDGATLPTYTPGSDCNGEEHSNNPGEYFQCLVNPVNKIMKGRSVSGAHYAAHSFTIPANEVAICQHDEGFEFNDNGNPGVLCEASQGETAIQAASELKLDFGLGWNFGISVTNTNYTVNFTENFVDIGAVLNAEGKATAYTQTKLSCSYSLVEALDPGTSLAE